MTGEHVHSWTALLMLGAFHGINPAMGWLFAVALGLQQNRRAAVLRALLPLGLGHALAILAAILVAAFIGLALPISYLRWMVAAILIAVGVRFFLRHPHLHWAGMRVGAADLTLWSFLVATVHGAGLMVVPVFLAASAGTSSAPAHHHLAAGSAATAVFATLLHAGSYLAVTGLLALLVFEKLGLGLLRKAWFNLDYLWAAALVGTGAATLLI
ncbi:MAG TPA: hypothetical protein VEH30_02130 [Terriglobales bacterium]|nr:hypothetical protein [Terriglobales bacterium]